MTDKKIKKFIVTAEINESDNCIGCLLQIGECDATICPSITGLSHSKIWKAIDVSPIEVIEKIMETEMTDEEKIKKFNEIRDGLWNSAKNGNLLLSTFSSALIRAYEIESADGEDPESA